MKKRTTKLDRKQNVIIDELSDFMTKLIGKTGDAGYCEYLVFCIVGHKIRKSSKSAFNDYVAQIKENS